MKTSSLFSKKLSNIIFMSTMFLGGCTITDVTPSTSGPLGSLTLDVTLNRFVDIGMASIQKKPRRVKVKTLMHWLI